MAWLQSKKGSNKKELKGYLKDYLENLKNGCYDQDEQYIIKYSDNKIVYVNADDFNVKTDKVKMTGIINICRIDGESMMDFNYDNIITSEEKEMYMDGTIKGTLGLYTNIVESIEDYWEYDF